MKIVIVQGGEYHSRCETVKRWAARMNWAYHWFDTPENPIDYKSLLGVECVARQLDSFLWMGEVAKSVDYDYLVWMSPETIVNGVPEVDWSDQRHLSVVDTHQRILDLWPIFSHALWWSSPTIIKRVSGWFDSRLYTLRQRLPLFHTMTTLTEYGKIEKLGVGHMLSCWIHENNTYRCNNVHSAGWLTLFPTSKNDIKQNSIIIE